MSKRPPGLQFDKKTKTWSIDKTINGQRIRRNLRSSTQREAEIEFFNILGGFGVTKKEGELTFREAALKYIKETSKRSLDRDVVTLKAVEQIVNVKPSQILRRVG